MTVLLLNCVPDDVDVEADGDGFVVTVPACESDDGGTLVTLDCRLDPMPLHGPGTYEFSYNFTVVEFDGGALAYQTQDREEVERYFDGHTREHVLPTVCAAVAALVEYVQPHYIFRVTKGLNLPQKALVKHFLVTDTLLGLGYREVDTGTDEYNRLFWFMAR
jgi:hypothetical protein